MDRNADFFFYPGPDILLLLQLVYTVEYYKVRLFHFVTETLNSNDAVYLIKSNKSFTDPTNILLS